MPFRFTRRPPWQVGHRGWGFGITSKNRSALVLVDPDALTAICTRQRTAARSWPYDFHFSIFDELEVILRRVAARGQDEGDYDFVIRREDVIAPPPNPVRQ